MKDIIFQLLLLSVKITASNNKNILKPRGYKISLELLIKGNYNTVKEIPITFYNRTKGQSKLNTKVQFEYLQQLFELYLFRLKRLIG